MHMSDALISPLVGGVMYAASTGTAAYAVHKIKQEELCEKRLPVMAVSGAFVFAAQMINFSIPATGSSGHIGGGILLAGLLGGCPAFLAITAVLLIQCLFFADGGLLALGANIFNMGVIPCLLVYPLLFRPLLKKQITARRIAAASILSAVFSLQLGSFGVVLETLASGVTELPFGTFLAWMQPIHLLIGLAEGIVTAGILQFVHRMRPELLEESIKGQPVGEASVKKTVILLALTAVFAAGGLSLYASANPDGLEWSVERTAGSAELTQDGAIYHTAAEIQEKTAVLPDYDFAEGDGDGTSLAGILGAGITCILIGIIGFLISKLKKKHK